jgi:hypothetical protein
MSRLNDLKKDQEPANAVQCDCNPCGCRKSSDQILEAAEREYSTAEMFEEDEFSDGRPELLHYHLGRASGLREAFMILHNNDKE